MHVVTLEIRLNQPWIKAGHTGRTVQPVCVCGWEGPEYSGHEESRAQIMASKHTAEH